MSLLISSNSEQRRSLDHRRTHRCRVGCYRVVSAAAQPVPHRSHLVSEKVPLFQVPNGARAERHVLRHHNRAHPPLARRTPHLLRRFCPRLRGLSHRARGVVHRPRIHVLEGVQKRGKGEEQTRTRVCRTRGGDYGGRLCAASQVSRLKAMN